jgi:hypothetical protein
VKPIGIIGHDACGKSSLAKFIQRAATRQGLDCLTVSFAAALRCEVEHAGFRNPWRKPTPEHYRALLRAWGWARRVENGEDYWLNQALEAIRERINEGDLTVTDDVRHLNEARWFSQNGILVKLDRPATDPRVTDADPPIIREVDAGKKLATVSIRNDTDLACLESWASVVLREAVNS